MTSGDGGQYNLKWDNIGNVVAGKGWRTGSDRYADTFYLPIYAIMKHQGSL